MRVSEIRVKRIRVNQGVGVVGSASLSLTVFKKSGHGIAATPLLS